MKFVGFGQRPKTLSMGPAMAKKIPLIGQSFTFCIQISSRTWPRKRIKVAVSFFRISFIRLCITPLRNDMASSLANAYAANVILIGY